LPATSSHPRPSRADPTGRSRRPQGQSPSSSTLQAEDRAPQPPAGRRPEVPEGAAAHECARRSAATDCPKTVGRWLTCGPDRCGCSEHLPRISRSVNGGLLEAECPQQFDGPYKQPSHAAETWHVRSAGRRPRKSIRGGRVVCGLNARTSSSPDLSVPVPGGVGPRRPRPRTPTGPKASIPTLLLSGTFRMANRPPAWGREGRARRHLSRRSRHAPCFPPGPRPCPARKPCAPRLPRRNAFHSRSPTPSAPCRCRRRHAAPISPPLPSVARNSPVDFPPQNEVGEVARRAVGSEATGDAGLMTPPPRPGAGTSPNFRLGRKHSIEE